MGENRRPLGETLIEAGVLTAPQLETALALQEKRQIRLGTILLQEGIVSEPQLVQALSRQLSIPWVSLWHIDIPEHLLRLVTVTLAEEFFLVPIYVRSSPKGEKTLYVAMNDPTDETALRFVSAAAGMAVRPMIAGPSDIAAAIRAYYYGEDDSVMPPDPTAEPIAPPVPKPAAPQRPKPPLPRPARKVEALEEIGQDEVEEWQSGVHKISDIDDHIEAKRLELEKAERAERAAAMAARTVPAPPVAPPPPEPEASAPASADPPSDPAGPVREVHQREVERHMFGLGHGGGRPKSLSLTLLDGTTISFGGARQGPGTAPGELSQDGLLRALRAAAQGTPVDGYLPSDKWEVHFAALLEVLFRKRLVSFEEYLEALKKKS